MYLGLHVPHRESIAIKSIAGLLAAINHETSQIIYNHILHRYQILVIGQLFNTCELFNNFLLMLPLFLNLTKTQNIDIPSTFNTESVSNVSVSVLLKANFFSLLLHKNHQCTLPCAFNNNMQYFFHHTNCFRHSAPSG